MLGVLVQNPFFGLKEGAKDVLIVESWDCVCCMLRPRGAGAKSFSQLEEDRRLVKRLNPGLLNRGVVIG